MINATPSGSYGTELGDPEVIVAVIDTGIDGSHPDIAPNFNKGLTCAVAAHDRDLDGREIFRR